MNLEEAKKVFLDAISYARWRKGDPLPQSLSDLRVVEAMRLVWKDVFKEEMTFVELSGMQVPESLWSPDERKVHADFRKENGLPERDAVETRTILVWPDGSWCEPEEIESMLWMSDDYFSVEVPLSLEDEDVDEWIVESGALTGKMKD